MYESDTHARSRAVRSMVPLARALLFAIVGLIVLASGHGVASAAAVHAPFPRLAVWWPDFARQSVTDIARGDWIALQAQDVSRIPALRAANPDAFILGPTAARELNYRLGSYDDPLNVELRSASTDWMLTQVGSVLTDDISASATHIPVRDASRFAAGEMALVDHELVRIVTVGSASLTVAARGPLNPPASHEQGARIASVVSHWPNSIAMDLSSVCPTRDVGFGPETWTGWNVRRAQRTLRSGDWDGLLIDGYEGNISWMTTNGDCRSIDLWRTNTPTKDGYAAFNAAWNAGAEAYGYALRQGVGDAVIVGNGNMRCWAVNGTVFEGFPYATLPPTWWNYIFVGPYGYPRASYPDWMRYGATPNLTLVQTYGAKTDYRLMRYGLCSALLDNGFFSYARSSAGHAVNGLDWYDEFDNAGAGQGYLGQPMSRAVSAGSAWRRDFEGGVALVNPTASAVTVRLGATFRKIRGTQDPKVNSGALVTSVTLQGRDGIVLLRVPQISLHASRSTLVTGGVATLTAGISPTSRSDIRFERRVVGTTTWIALGAVAFDASGVATIAVSPRMSTEYRAYFVTERIPSPTVKVSVRPLATLKVSVATVRRGRGVTFSGSVTYRGSVALRLQRRVGHTWKTVRTFATSSTGRFSKKLVCSIRGSFVYRVYTPTATRHLAVASNTMRVTVR